MTTKTISSTIAAGYTLAASFSELELTATGEVEGKGIFSGHLATILNLGKVVASGQARGISLAAGGEVINGSTASSAALINGYGAIDVAGAAGQVTNFGSIGGGGRFGVNLEKGGTVDNLGTAAVIGWGVTVGPPGTVFNEGVIGNTTANIPPFAGVYLPDGGTVTNGSSTDHTAIIQGRNGVYSYAGAPVTLDNFGRIEGVAGSGVFLDSAFPETIVNELGATISGDTGVNIGGATTVDNQGLIQGPGPGGGSVGIVDTTSSAGRVTNGSASNHNAVISGGYTGLYAIAGVIQNFASILGISRDGAELRAAPVFNNGSSTDHAAIVKGVTGITAAGSALIRNFGVVEGTGGTAFSSSSSGVQLFLEPGGTFQGKVLGGGGILVLDTGKGAVTGNSSGALSVGFSGASPYSCTNFGKLEVNRKADFTLVDAWTVAGGQSLIDLGVLKAGALTSSGLVEATGGGQATFGNAVNDGHAEASGGTLTFTGNVTGTGMLIVAGGGSLSIDGTTKEPIHFLGAGSVGLVHSTAYGGEIDGFSTLDRLDLIDIAFIQGKTTATYKDNGMKTGGVLTVTDGTHTAHLNMVGDYTNFVFKTATDNVLGTYVTMAAKPSAALFAAHAAAAMARAGPSAAIAPRDAFRPPPLITAPHAQLA